MIFGAVGSLQESAIQELEKLNNFNIAKNDFLPNALVLKLAELTDMAKDEIAVYISRKGKVVGVVVGDHSSEIIPELSKFKGQNLLSGIRCIHTHATEDGRLSPQDLQALISFRLDGMVSIGTQKGKYTNIMAAIPTIGNNFSIEKADLFGPFKLGEKNFSIVFRLIEEIDTCLRTNPVHQAAEPEEEKVVLVGLNTEPSKRDKGVALSHSLYELELVARSAGAQVLEKLVIESPPDPLYYIDLKKTPELILLCQLLGATTIVFDTELTGNQIRNLEQEIKIKVIDRTLLILDLFSKRATSRESKVQVELAQLKYLFPRLLEDGLHIPDFNRGLGTRSPANKKLEEDRLSVRQRIRTLAEDLEEVRKKHKSPKENRRKNPVVALVGYINSGKSTILYSLSNPEEAADSKSLSSINTTAKKISLPNGEQVAIVDTVGFIKDLPVDLTEAFKSTLEDVCYADVIVHVVDSSAKDIASRVAVVNSILDDINVLNKPIIIVLSKIDICSENKHQQLAGAIKNGVEISAKQKTGLDKLLYAITKILFMKPFKADFFIPYNESWAIQFFHEKTQVLMEDCEQEGTRITAYITHHLFEQVKQFACGLK